jgi:hypothetical protein
MPEIKDTHTVYGPSPKYEVKSSKVVTYKIRPCPFCHKAPKEIMHMTTGAILKDGSIEESRAVTCQCGIYGPIRDSAASAVAAWNGIE